MNGPRMNLGFAAFLLILSLHGCTPAPDTPPPETANRESGLPADFLEERRFALEENDSVLNVLPFMTEVTEDGLLVVTDMGDARVRVYSEQGALVRQIGRRGDGPDEFTLPFSTHWLPDGRAIVADVLRGVSIWDQASGRADRRLDREGRMTFAAKGLGDSAVVLGGYTPGTPDPRLLRLVHLSDGTAGEEFFPLPLPPELQPAATQVAGVVLAVDGESILAAYTLSDTLFTFDQGGMQTGAFPLPIPGFSYDLASGVADVRIIRSIFPTDSLWVIQYGSAPPAEPRHGLLLLDRNGTVLRAWQDTPQLLGVRWPHFWFLDPASPLPNQVVVGRFEGG